LNDATFSGAVTESSGTLVLEDRGATFDGTVTVSGGVLDDLGQSLTMYQTYTQTAGTLILSGIGGQFNNDLLLSGGTIDVQSGTLGLAGAEITLDGRLTGAGAIVVEGEQLNLNGTTTLGSKTVFSTGKFILNSGVLSLASAAKAYILTDPGYFLTTNTGIVELGGNSLVLNGGAELADQISGGGTVTLKAGGQLDGVTVNNSATLSVNSAVTVVPLNDGPGLVTLENNSAIYIAAGASLRLTGNDLINDLTANSSLLDNGLLNSASGTGLAEIVPSFNEFAAGTISIAIGALDFSGVNNTFSGLIAGAGTLSLGADYTGQPTSFMFGSKVALDVANFALEGRTVQDQLTISNSLTYGGSWDQSGGLFLYGNGATGSPTLDLTGSVILDGGVIKTNTGTINTTSLVSLGNNANYQLGVDIEGFTVFVVNDLVRQDASMQLGAQSGSKPTADISSGGTWLLQDAASIIGPYGTVVNNGTLNKNIGSGVSAIQGVLNNSALVEISAGQLLLDGSGTLEGTITGSGQLDLEGNGAYTLGGSSGSGTLTLSVSHILIDNTPFGTNASVVSLAGNNSYAGIWGQHGGTVQLDGDTLTLSNVIALDGGFLTGPGTLVSSGSATVGGDPNANFTIGSSAVLDITRVAEQSTTITVGSLADLNIASGATYTIDDTASIFGNGTITLAGTLVSNGSGYLTIDPAIQITGQVSVGQGTLAFMGSVTDGAFIIDKGAELDLDSAVSGATITMSASGASLLIGDAAAYTGVVNDFVSTDLIEISQLASGVIHDSLSANKETLTIYDSSNHTFTVDFAQAQTLSGTGSLVVADGPNGYIGIYHT